MLHYSPPALSRSLVCSQTPSTEGSVFFHEFLKLITSYVLNRKTPLDGFSGYRVHFNANILTYGWDTFHGLDALRCWEIWEERKSVKPFFLCMYVLNHVINSDIEGRMKAKKLNFAQRKNNFQTVFYIHTCVEWDFFAQTFPLKTARKGKKMAKFSFKIYCIFYFPKCVFYFPKDDNCFLILLQYIKLEVWKGIASVWKTFFLSNPSHETILNQRWSSRL